MIKKLHRDRQETTDEREQEDGGEREELSSIIDALQAKLRSGAERFSTMEQQYQSGAESLREQFQKEKREEHAKVSTFVLRLDQRDRRLAEDVVERMEEGQLRDVAKQLVREYNVRLLAVDCGLSFLLDVPEAEWAVVEEWHVQMGEVLQKLLPRDVRHEVKWRSPILCRANQPNTESSRGPRRQLFGSGPIGQQNGGREEPPELNDGGFHREAIRSNSEPPRYATTKSTGNQRPQNGGQQIEELGERNPTTEAACKETPKGRLTRTKPSSSDDSVFLEGPEDCQQASHRRNNSGGDAQSTGPSRTPSSPPPRTKETRTKKPAFYAEQKQNDEQNPDKTVRLDEEPKPAKDTQLESLRSKIKELEDELEREKVKSPGGGAAGRKEEDRRITVRLGFQSTKPHGVGLPFSNVSAPVDLAQVTRRLADAFHVSLLGVFHEYTGDCDIHPAFVLQTSMAEWPEVKKRKADIQEALSALLADPDVVWSEMAIGLVDRIDPD